MFNPSDLEGEVDHSFFDSDCDDDSISRDGGKKMEKGLKTEKRSPQAHERLHPKQTENTKGAWSPRANATTTHLKPLKNNRSSREEEKESCCQSKEEAMSRSSSISSVSCTSDRAIKNFSDGSIRSESLLGDELVLRCPGRRHRKNYSFTNDEVQNIDLENQRLLRVLSRLSAGPRPGGAAGKKTGVTGNSPAVRLSHSALNRQREQQRIERENLAFLKRLESIKPTPGLKRSEQLADYQRYSAYPMSASTTTVVRATRKTPLACSRPTSSTHHNSRAVSASTRSSNTPRSKKQNTARPAWC